MIKLINGDCLEEMDKMIKNGVKVDAIITDPPYKTTSRGSSGGTGGMLKDKLNKQGKVFKHNDIKFSEWLPKCYEILKDNSHAYFMTNNKNLKEMLIEVEEAGFKVFKTLIWVKNTSITNMYYMDSHEYIIFCRKGKAKKINNCGTKSVLFFDNPRNKVHPTEKPVELMQTFVENSTNIGDLVFDPFVGAGATALACKSQNRNCIACEIDEKYFNISQERINEPIQQELF